jgi:hypothetical protein
LLVPLRAEDGAFSRILGWIKVLVKGSIEIYRILVIGDSQYKESTVGAREK